MIRLFKIVLESDTGIPYLEDNKRRGKEKGRKGKERERERKEGRKEGRKGVAYREFLAREIIIVFIKREREVSKERKG